MDNIELRYQGIKDAIKGELNRVAESFVEIGYRLKQVRDGELYKIDGYSNINEFAKAEYSLSQSTTSRFITINDSFSLNGSSPKLLEQFEGFGYSKLSEMLTLPEEQLKLITLRTTVAEIREIKQVKKEADNEIYATSHNPESLDFAQSEANFDTVEKYIIPEADKLLIEFFRDKARRQTMKDLAILLSATVTNETITKAAEIINPSGHLMHRKGMVIMIFEENHIKYSKFGGTTAEYTYTDFIHDLLKAFDMSNEDPWVAFYGEPEPDPVPEPIKKEPEKKEIPKAPVKMPDKKAEKPKTTQSIKPVIIEDEPEEDDSEKIEDTEEEDNIPGQLEIDEYPEYAPEGTEEQVAEETIEVVEAEIVHSQNSIPENDLKVTFDETAGEIEVLIKGCRGIKLIRVIDIDTGESWEVAIGEHE